MTVRKKPEVHDTPRTCGARKKRGQGNCRRPAGWGTEHLGSGRCKLHGGASPIKHGRYSQVATRRLGELLAHHAEDPDPTNLLEELALMRALTEDYVCRLEAWREKERFLGALEAIEGKPRENLDVSDAIQLLDRIGAMAKRIEDMRAQNAIGERELRRALEAMRQSVRLHATPEAAHAIETEWLRIAL